MKKIKIKIKIHSLIDVITNSSTEIFVAASNRTIVFIKDFINTCLEIAERDDISADSLFNFGVELDDDGIIDQRRDYIKDILKGDVDLDKKDLDPKISAFVLNRHTLKIEKDLNKAIESVFDFYERSSIVNKPSWWNNFQGYYEQEYGMVTPSSVVIELKKDVEKDPRLIKLVNLVNKQLMGIFNIEAERLG